MKKINKKLLTISLLSIFGSVSVFAALGTTISLTQSNNKTIKINDYIKRYKTFNTDISQNETTFAKVNHFSHIQKYDLSDIKITLTLVQLDYDTSEKIVNEYNNLSLIKIHEFINNKFDLISDAHRYTHILLFKKLTKKTLDSLIKTLNSQSYIASINVSFKDEEITKNSVLVDNHNFQKYNLSTSFDRNFKTNRITDELREEIINNYLSPHQRTKIGILEVGENHDRSKSLINPYDKDFFVQGWENNPHYITNNWSHYYKDGLLNKPQYGQHATHVAAIAGGKAGINPYTHLHGVFYNEWNGILQEFNELYHNQHVDIINNSYSRTINSNNLNDSRYTSESSYIDNWYYEYPDTIAVYAAGNDNDPKNKVGYLDFYNLTKNSILVGANDYLGNITYFSNFANYDSNHIRKVDILANGDNYDLGLFSGTSLSAPLVSGLLSHLMKKYNHIFAKGKKNIIAKSILGSSTYSNDKTNKNGLKNNETETLDASKLKNALESLKYFVVGGKSSRDKIYWFIKDSNRARTLYNSTSFYYENELSSKKIVLKEVELKKGDVVRGSLAWDFYPTHLINGVPKVNDFDLYLFNKDTGENVAYSLSATENVENIKYRVNKDGTYQFKVELNNKLMHDKDFNHLAFSYTIGKD